MHKLTPAQHASMGWSHGQYKNGNCLALMIHYGPKEVEVFMAEAKERGAQYIALWNLPEYMP
jgi:hypothetical protein